MTNEKKNVKISRQIGKNSSNKFIQFTKSYKRLYENGKILKKENLKFSRKMW